MPANLRLSFIVILNRKDPSSVRCIVSEFGGQVHHRVAEAVKYVAALLTEQVPESHLSGTGAEQGILSTILFQAADRPVDMPSVGWESQMDWNNIRLVPDLYYFKAHGYADFLPPGSSDCPEWNDRNPTIFWRGQTTGMLNITSDSLQQLPRYRLCRAAQRLGVKADVGLTGVVQAASPEHHKQVVAIITADQIMKPFVKFKQFAAHKFVIDIDGNASAWNFVQKLRLGACILKTGSKWRQWMSDRLIPWHHYVPIAEDLRDFEEKIDWCFSNDSAVKEIAANGRLFALSLDFGDEMRLAAKQLRLSAGDSVSEALRAFSAKCV
jgi:hypothetical protein